jgi:sulfur carrier protein
MRIRLNGEERDVADATSVPDLLTTIGLGLGWVVVELNGVALLRSEAAEAVLSDGDVVEVVRAVAGG